MKEIMDKKKIWVKLIMRNYIFLEDKRENTLQGEERSVGSA